MGKRLIEICKVLANKFISSSKRFPETILLSAGIVLLLCIENHMAGSLTEEQRELIYRTSLIFGLGIPITLSIKVFLERKPMLGKLQKVLLYLLAIVGLVLYHKFLLKDMEIIPMIRYLALNITFYCTFLFIPYFYKRENYSLYIVDIVTKFFSVYLYSLILFTGLAAMLGMIHALFSLDISDKVYIDIGFIVAGIFAPIFFLGDLPKRDEELTSSCYPKVLKVLLLYVVTPLMIAYSITLYVYFAKILVTMQWPEGIVANLVMWYALLGIVVTFLIYPLREDNRLAKVFIRWFPIFVIPLIGMMFAALGMRIQAYGMTENRYFPFVTGCWITACMLYFSVVKKPRMIVLTISIAVLSVLSVLGPWSCFSVASSSQNARLERILEKYDVVLDGKIHRISTDFSKEDKKEIVNIIDYFDRYKKLQEVEVLPDGFTIKQMQAVFGFVPTRRHDIYFVHKIDRVNYALDIKDFEYYIEFILPKVELPNEDSSVSITYTKSSGDIQILRDQQVIYEGNVKEVAMRIHQNHQDGSTLKRKELIIMDENDNIRVGYVLKNISGTDDDGDIEIYDISFSMLIKLK
ncbi:DUF4153 domain-containing protein [Anaerosinus massiliensis]|uniref:DUF4153 domain-containing protein n=1 Tax=Massilibacillus massiliensis TaxID=1806837 RepID=UPI000DA5FC42|nr:DUF4153 domain-containing protein [Massilibacillus massiliensis]